MNKKITLYDEIYGTKDYDVLMEFDFLDDQHCIVYCEQYKGQEEVEVHAGIVSEDENNLIPLNEEQHKILEKLWNQLMRNR